MKEFWQQSPLADIVEKVQAGERLSREDGLRLFQSHDLLTIGYMADMVRRRKNGDTVYFINNRHINPTNICVKRCALCAFGVDADDPRAYNLSLDEVEAKVRESMDSNPSEIHIVGGLHRDVPFSYQIEMLERVRRVMPDTHIQAFTAVEIDYFAEQSGLTVREVLEKLIAAGLGSLPGGGAEIFSERVRAKIAKDKIPGSRWLEIHGEAHRLGLKTNATMLYGHMETLEERVDHMIRLREQQDKTGGFQTFIPLAFHPKNTALEGEGVRTTGFEDLKCLAVGRLMLDNFDHIKAFWIMIGPKLAQVSLAFGVDDIDGTVVEEKIFNAAGSENGQAMTRKELTAMIRAAGRVPVERDTLYRVIRTFEA
ncbi:aminofutalosine synthase MqnE [Heliophilum fasciatum]|uniref:Aminodeoxyfutalosine synthase n=1 Tax=Heliophilum fasciatum TaxID=35700 RepID=A0A4R2RL47_9FIRM|nr:aminofutalosine synthase MqnE [Heliophilum fasciatum]MCW2278458.1 aminodeoxyfutalosine synthase [Heliophilum fasciatum]TCP63588.1 de-hypoxanthine futalosine cyclase [Heliophilum fasciatum]